jgi:hypothetical protein
LRTYLRQAYRPNVSELFIRAALFPHAPLLPVLCHPDAVELAYPEPLGIAAVIGFVLGALWKK